MIKIELIALIAFFNLILFVTLGSAQVQVNPGRVVGNIYFVNAPSAVSTYLSANPVAVNPATIPEMFPVKLYLSSSGLPAATAHYTPINVMPDALTYIAGSFDINPNVEPASSDDFILQIESVVLANGAKYRLGSLETGSPSYRVCQDVLPLPDNPTGTACDIDECAVLANLNIKFVGNLDDLNALDHSYLVTCQASAYVNEVAGSDNFAWQADSPFSSFTVDTLRTTGASLPMLIRASNSRIKVVVNCNAKIRNGETGFVTIPSTLLTPFGAINDIGPFTCGNQPGSPIDVNITIERTAGILEGLFDVSGHDETPPVELSILGLPYYFRTFPLSVSAGDVPTVSWRFEGAPEGSHRIIVKAIVDGGSKLLYFPLRQGFNQEVTVTAQQTTNVGSTFIAKPRTVEGKLVFIDPPGGTDLKNIVTRPFADIYGHSGQGYSYMEAEGENVVASNTPECIMRSSGVGGESRGIIIGAYDSSQNIAEFNYELLLAGLSPDNGAVDGTNACPAQWTMRKVHAEMITDLAPSPPGSSYIDIRFDQFFPLRFDVNAEPIQFPEQKICFGKLKLDLHLNPSLGTIYAPEFAISQEGIGVAPNEFGTIYSFMNGRAFGIPLSSSERASNATVSVTLPEGLKYHISPRIRIWVIDQSSGSGTYIYMPNFTFPSEGFLGCSEIDDICALMDNEGNYSLLSISFPSDTDYCLTNGNLGLNVSITLSDYSNVARVGYLLDPPNIDTATLNDPNAVILCPSNCGPNPDYIINLSSLSPGPHALTIVAMAANTCISKKTYHFQVQSEPLALHCPGNFTVELLPDETSILAGDQRVADQLVPSISGGCNLPITPYNDIPDEFSVGVTIVNFWLLAPQELACSTSVTVIKPKHELAFFKESSIEDIFNLNVYSIETDSMRILDIVSSPTWLAYSKSGNRLGVTQKISTDAIKIIDADSGSQLVMADTPNDCRPFRIAFNPVDESRYAVVCAEGPKPDKKYPSYSILAFSESTLLASTSFPSTSEYEQMSLPEIAWSNGGNHIAAVFTTPLPGERNETRLLEWELTDDTLSLSYQERITNETPPREKVHMIMGTGSSDEYNEYGFATTKGVYKAATGEGPGPLLINALPNLDMDINRGIGPNYAAVISDRLDYQMGVLRDIGSHPNDIIWCSHGKTVNDQSAISSDRKYVAIQTPLDIYIHPVPDCYPSRRIAPLNKPSNIVFRPIPPE